MRSRTTPSSREIKKRDTEIHREGTEDTELQSVNLCTSLGIIDTGKQRLTMLLGLIALCYVRAKIENGDSLPWGGPEINCGGLYSQVCVNLSTAFLTQCIISAKFRFFLYSTG